MVIRYSERVWQNEEKKFKKIMNELQEMLHVFGYSNNNITEINRAKLVRKIYILILTNIRLFHKFFDHRNKLNQLFEIITKKGYELLHSERTNKTIEKIIEKPILDLVTYIYKYNETISRVSYKLTNKLNKDVTLNILSFIPVKI
jgi:hypothetical protein